MNVGMLWTNSDKKLTVEQKIREAADYYFIKYGDRPNLCHVNPSNVPDGSRIVSGVKLVGSKLISVNDYWIGVDGNTEPLVKREA